MRILIVNKYAHVTGGADRHCIDLARALRTAGHEVLFLSTESNRNLESRGEFIPLLVSQRSRDNLTARQKTRVAARAPWNPAAGAAMRRLLDTFSPDVVHAHKLYPQLSVAPILVAASRKIPVVQTLHDYEFLSASQLDHTGRRVDRVEEKVSFRLLNSLTYPIRLSVHSRCVSRWIAISDFIAHCYARRGFAPVTIPNFLYQSDAGGKKRSFSDRTGIAFVGRLTSEKGVLDVIELAQSLRDIRITVVGDGPLSGAVAQASRRLPNLAWVGQTRREDAASIMSTTRVVVVPSRWEEPGGLVALEAMSVGTPVVCYRRGGLAEYVSAAGGGKVVPDSLEALTRTCAAVHEDADLWALLSARACQGIAHNHSPEAYIERLIEVYEQA